MTKAPAISWTRAMWLSSLVTYGPFLVMATYTLAFVSCSHCRKSAWELLPAGPGLVPLDAGRIWLNFPRPAQNLSFAIAVFASLILVAIIASLIRRLPRFKSAIAWLAFGIFTALATCVLALIRA